MLHYAHYFDYSDVGITHGDLTRSRIMKCVHNLPDDVPLCPWNSVKADQKKKKKVLSGEKYGTGFP